MTLILNCTSNGSQATLLTRFTHAAASLLVMNSLTYRELLDTQQTSESAPTLRDFVRAPAIRTPAKGQRALGGLVAIAVQVLFVSGIVYGTMNDLVPQLDKIMVVSVLDEAPLIEDLPPPPPPTFDQPVIHMAEPLVTIAQPEPAPTAPTAIISNAPTPVPAARVDTAERDRLIGEFMRAMQRHLIREMRYPLAARARKEEGVVYVRVAMDRAGHVLSAKIQEGSSSADLNAEGLAVIQRAQPLPVPPSVVTGDPVDLIIPVTFSLRIGRGGRGGRSGGAR